MNYSRDQKLQILIFCSLLISLFSACTSSHVVQMATLPQPQPTRADGVAVRSRGMLVTPYPNERLKLGQIREIASLPTVTPEPSRFSIRNEFQGDETNRLLTLYVTDTNSGTEQRLGDDSGSATFGAMDNSKVIWTFLCDPCSTVQSGLYAYLPGIDAEFLSSQHATKPKISGDWVVYLSVEGMSSTYGDLYVSNLQSGEQILIENDFVKIESGMENYFTIGENKVAWIGMGQPPKLYLYDLTTRTNRQLTVPEIAIPSHLSIQGNLVTWLDEFWQGYDLNTDAYFTIPVIPPTWEHAVIQQISPVIAVNDQLFWSITFDDQIHYLTAPVIPNPQ